MKDGVKLIIAKSVKHGKLDVIFLDFINVLDLLEFDSKIRVEGVIDFHSSCKFFFVLPMSLESNAIL